jgi:hypothetical protein
MQRDVRGASRILPRGVKGIVQMFAGFIRDCRGNGGGRLEVIGKQVPQGGGSTPASSCSIPEVGVSGLLSLAQ